jgi:formylglycine-generating enzyme
VYARLLDMGFSLAEKRQSWVLASAGLLLFAQASIAAPNQTLLNVGQGPAPVKAAQVEASHCGEGMSEVSGDYCENVAQKCIKWIGKDGQKQDRCAEYAPETSCVGSKTAKHFCIDKYEYPNKVGEKPVVAVTFEDAQTQCEAAGKRLCGSQEWTVACEGPEHLPYPTGYARNAEACNLDKPYIVPDNQKYASLSTRADELARTDQRDPSGGNPSCVSPHGVSDMVGNVDEWVMNENGFASKAPYKSGLKGGYWGPVRNRCRPMTTAHNQWHSGYQVGFRCCSDPRE